MGLSIRFHHQTQMFPHHGRDDGDDDARGHVHGHDRDDGDDDRIPLQHQSLLVCNP